MIKDEAISTSLCTYHDLKAIDIVRNFTTKTAHFFGANIQEIYQIEIATEEASFFIISSLHPDKEKLFEINISPIESGLRFYFYSKGMPIDKENLPIYDSKNPENSIEGLPFFLLESLTDSMEFKNEGKNGWVLIFEKYLHSFKPLEAKKTINEETYNNYAKERLKISLAKPNDAYEIVKLTYLTYRYSYAKEIFYYRKKLQEAIESNKIIVFTAKNFKEEVVVCSAFLRSENCDKIVEAGMLMSKPEYRKNSALLLLSRKQSKFLDVNDYGISIAYSHLVTTHTRSQRLIGHFGFFPTALKFSVHKSADFVGINSDKSTRESLLYALRIASKLEPMTLFLPIKHLKMTKKLLENFDNINFITKEVKTKDIDTQLKIEKNSSESYATITLEQLGKNWIKDLKNELKKLRDDGIITIYTHISTQKSLPIGFEKSINQIGLFYSGIMIKTTKKWELLYTLLQGQHFDFDSIKLNGEKAIELKNYIQNEYLRIQ